MLHWIRGCVVLGWSDMIVCHWIRYDELLLFIDVIDIITCNDGCMMNDVMNKWWDVCGDPFGKPDVLICVNLESCIMVYRLHSIFGEPRSYGGGLGVSS